jgi:hypothetical protein
MKWVKVGKQIKLMVSIVLNQLVSIIKGTKREGGLAPISDTCQVNSTTKVTKELCQVNNVHPVTACKRYAMFQEMGEGNND